MKFEVLKLLGIKKFIDELKRQLIDEIRKITNHQMQPEEVATLLEYLKSQDTKDSHVQQQLVQFFKNISELEKQSLEQQEKLKEQRETINTLVGWTHEIADIKSGIKVRDVYVDSIIEKLDKRSVKYYRDNKELSITTEDMLANMDERVNLCFKMCKENATPKKVRKNAKAKR